MVKRTIALSVALASVGMLGGTLLVAVPAAHADTRCSSQYIVINGNQGAESPSGAFGHSHLTGNHYIRSQSGNLLTYWADNNGGSNKDTWDTYYGQIRC